MNISRFIFFQFSVNKNIHYNLFYGSYIQFVDVATVMRRHI